MSATVSWQQLPTDTIPPSYYTTTTEDVILPFDVSALLINGAAPTNPTAVLLRLSRMGTGTPVTMQDTPAVASPTVINQRIRGLVANAVYRLYLTFTTGGQQRTTSRVIIVGD